MKEFKFAFITFSIMLWFKADSLHLMPILFQFLTRGFRFKKFRFPKERLSVEEKTVELSSAVLAYLNLFHCSNALVFLSISVAKKMCHRTPKLFLYRGIGRWLLIVGNQLVAGHLRVHQNHGMSNIPFQSRIVWHWVFFIWWYNSSSLKCWHKVVQT